jgi:tRNA pseudouridine38-40 synthase
MTRYRFDIAYDGTAYAGWQVQPNGVTVQATIEKALLEVTGGTVKVHGSGRTDQGVHARRQVAHGDVETRLSPGGLARALNALLPDDIRMLRVQAAAADFHARKHAVSKEYRYFIWNGEVLPPHLRHTRTHVRKPLNVAAMRQAAAHLVGRHDFAAFTANPNRLVQTTVRRLLVLDVRKRGHEITIVASGEGFLYKMVRSLAGWLIRVGEGGVPPSRTRDILSSRVRTARVPTAPPQGLFLWQVRY